MGWRTEGRGKIKAGSVAALACGFLLRLSFVLHHPRFGGDTLIYGHLAHNLLAHHVFSFDEATLQPTLIRLPGYPAFLAGCFALLGDQNYVGVIWLQALLDLAGCVVLAFVAGRLMGQRAGRATLWLAALCPFTANYTATALTETTSILCVIGGIACLLRWTEEQKQGTDGWRWASGCGTAIAAAVMLRPDQGLLAAALLPAMFVVAWRSERPGWRRLLPVVLAGAILATPMVLWGLRNWRVFHVVQPLAPRYANDPGEMVPLGFQRWYRTWAIDYKSTYDTYWNYDGALLSVANLPARAFDNEQQRSQTAAVIDQYNLEQSSTPALDQEFARIADARTAARPWRVHVLLPVARVLNMWLRPRTEWMKVPLDWWNIHSYGWLSVGALVYALLNGGYLLLAALGCLRWWHARWSGYGSLAAGMLGFVVLRCALLLNLDNSEPRYTLECFPVVILLAGFWFAKQPGAASSGESLSLSRSS